MHKLLSILAMLLVGLSAYSQDILGCTDPNAPNYNPSATIDNGTWDPERSLVEPLGEARRSRRVVP